MNIGQKFVVLVCVVLLVSSIASAQTPITVSSSEFSSYFNVGSPVQILVDTTIFSEETPMVYVGHQGGPNVYDFSNATLVEYVNDTLRSVSENEFLASRFASEYFTFAIPEGGESGGSDYPIISVTNDAFSVVGQYRVWTSDSVRVRHHDPGELIFPFPITYGDSVQVTNAYAETTYVSDSPFEPMSYDETRDLVVDGWGTILLPGGKSFPVLRVRDVSTAIDSMDFGGKEFRFLTQGGGMLFMSARYSDAPDTGWVEAGDPIQYIINPTITAASDIPTELPTGFELAQNYPNPFNPSTTIRYSLPVGSKVRLTVYSILGQELATLYEGEKSAGWHTVQWNAVSQPSGVYFVRLQAGSFISTRKVVLLK
ncbi:MAG: T9SS type A sorting domain-containing protein [Ignavibacteriae bacterium]|nr:T9SS type A sorting domain-containing protein [Ignavibacteriota bacterium]